jgi:hypothetical protein
MTLFCVLIVYLLLVWILPRILVPHLGFSREPLPAVLPRLLEEKMRQLNAEAKDDADFLRKAYAFVTERYRGSRARTITNFWRAFEDPLTREPGFMPCTGQNHLIRLLLVKSGRFQESDIKVRTVPLNLFIHQYLEVRVSEKWVDVDPWSAFLNVPLGQKSSLIG